jgi:hypothetical protein
MSGSSAFDASNEEPRHPARITQHASIITSHSMHCHGHDIHLMVAQRPHAQTASKGRADSISVRTRTTMYTRTAHAHPRWPNESCKRRGDLPNSSHHASTRRNPEPVSVEMASAETTVSLTPPRCSIFFSVVLGLDALAHAEPHAVFLTYEEEG